MSDPLPADLAAAVAAAGARLTPFDQIRYFHEVDSTNDVALAAAASGAPHGSVIVADTQRAGRGRLGRGWHSPPDAGLYMSAVVRPGDWPGVSLTTLAAGVAVARGLRSATGLGVELKWPNDVVVGRPWRKLAGILSEAATTDGRLAAVVVGIGLNIRSSAFPPDIADRATSLETELGRPVERGRVAAEVLAALSDAMSRLEHGGAEWVVREWRGFGRAGLGGASVRWSDETGSHAGVARDIDEVGALVVDAGGGRRVRLISGEVIWERVRSD